MNTDLIKQTAIDYAMTAEEVKTIYDRTNDSNFYDELESFIADRAKIDCLSKPKLLRVWR